MMFASGKAALFRRLARYSIARCDSEDPSIYGCCRRYVDRYCGENNDAIETNGELNLLRALLPAATNVFDIGANVGHWARHAVEINPNATLHCFEPSKPTFERLARQMPPGRVFLNNFGLGSRPEEKVLHVYEEASGMNSVYRREGLEDGWNFSCPTQSEMIRIETLDDYCRQQGIEKIDLLKLDVEGHELEVIKGASELLRRKAIEVIQIEYGGCNIDSRTFIKDFFAHLRPLSFAFYKIFPDSIRKIERYDQRLENFQYQNWVLIRDGDGKMAQAAHALTARSL